jgi:urease beta subunit
VTTGSGEQSSTGSSSGKNKSFAFSILDAVGQRFNIPASGRLRIEMKDGSVQEIDLTQVKKLQVKQ